MFEEPQQLTFDPANLYSTLRAVLRLAEMPGYWCLTQKQFDNFQITLIGSQLANRQAKLKSQSENWIGQKLRDPWRLA